MINAPTPSAPSLVISSKPPLKMIPKLIEWWLTRYNRYRDYECSEIFQIESVEEDDPFYNNTIAFTSDKTPSMIVSANTKTKTLVYLPEDTEGNPIIDPTMNKPQLKTVHCESILIYRCLSFSTVKEFEESGNSDVLGKRI